MSRAPATATSESPFKKARNRAPDRDDPNARLALGDIVRQ